MLNIILCGAPGCGKGTQSDLIVNKYGLTHLSTGELMRTEMASGSELGKLIDSYISQGQLVPDEVTIQMLEKHIDSLPAETKGLVFDGFPRTENQAVELEKLMVKRGDKAALLLDIHVPEDEVIHRLIERGKTSGRADDNLETIKQRLVVYHRQTEPVAAYYQLLDKYQAVDGLGTIPEIFTRIEKLLDEVYKG
ncbi:MAG: adenylate kinase [Paludibacteraceae bacterium]|nr:adenylate kinase [Paludibacteraceae bacterium]